jgi:glycosyltransferase involved in cell wall biosynthesis
MRIGIDARELCGRATGVGRYLTGLLHEWAAGGRACAHEFVLYAPEAIALPLDTRKFRTRVVAGAGGTWWEQVTLPHEARADAVDVWFAPAYTAPLGIGVPVVVAIHDLSFAAHPEWFGIRDGARRRLLARRSAQTAKAVITISQFSRQELIDRFGVEGARIHVIPPGVGTGEPRAAGPPGRSNPKSPQTSTSTGPLSILYVGSIFNRRHVIDLIRAFAPIARVRPTARLDIVGDNRTHPRQDLQAAIAAEGIGDQVRWHQYVTDEQLQDLYAGARVFAFLSEYEGLGLSPLEALAAAVPPVLFDTPVARECCGSAALYVPLNDLAAITRALEALLFDGQLRATILQAAPAELARYSWPIAGRETLAVLERAGSR